jgi:hypothetical protein
MTHKRAIIIRFDGSSVGPCLREITTSLFSLPSMFRSMANSSSPQPTESSSNEIQDLNFRIETLTKRLALYERDGEEEAKGGETNREEGEAKGRVEVIHPFHPSRCGEEDDFEAGMELRQVDV